MNRISGIIFMGACIVVLSSCAALSQTPERARPPVAQTWKLEDIYPSDQAWQQAKDKLASQLDRVLEHKGTLARSASALLACLNAHSQISQEFDRVANYAAMKSDQDTRDSKYLAMRQEIEQLATDYNSKASFIEPEIAAMDPATIEGFLAAEPGLKIYRMYLDDIQRTRAHRLSEKEEKILAEAGLIADAPASIYSIFSNAEMPWPQVTLNDGAEALLNKAGYARYRAAPDRSDREQVFSAFWTAVEKFKGTFGAQLYANVKKDMFYARTRRYESSLHAALDSDNIPTDVYMALIKNVRENLHSFHRYLALKKRMLGVDTLKYSDVYAPVVKGVDLQYSFDQAKALVLESVRPLGDDYAAIVKQACDNRWIDVHPTPGKRAGAYSNGSVYDVHPYILLNYNGQYEDVSTLAHELGHSLHSYYSNKNQPYPTADYSIFVAEVASTFNEALLMDRMLREIKDQDIRLSLLMSYLEGIRQTVFRQTQFAEFELKIHETVEQGRPLTGDLLSELYGRIIRDYYGHDEGVCLIDDLYTVEWAYVPHFYYNFYVYQYATSFTASAALAEEVLAGSRSAAQGYIEFLSAGGSDYPIEILKKAGVDMTTPAPFKKMIAAMNRTMDEIETILAQKARDKNAGK